MNDKEYLLAELEEKIGYTFVDKTMLQRALTAPSYRATHGLCIQEDNQRLEFLGDAVLGLLAAEHVYHKYDQHAEGVLTIQRSHLASGHALAVTARAIGLGAYMRIGLSDETTGGIDKEKLLADGMEAVFGSALSSRAAVHPSIPGRERSIKIRSGNSLRAKSIAACPLCASST
jgi:ribonuclease-3